MPDQSNTWASSPSPLGSVAVMYPIYTGGYRKAMEDSLREEKSERYLQLRPRMQAKFAREQAASNAP